VESKKHNNHYLQSETSVFQDSGENTEVAGSKLKRKEHYPGILEEGLIYSCAGPRIDPEET